jgi:hypothetical protein
MKCDELLADAHSVYGSLHSLREKIEDWLSPANVKMLQTAERLF